jgi:hypothetical protein
MLETRNTCRILAGNLPRKRSRGRAVETGRIILKRFLEKQVLDVIMS